MKWVDEMLELHRSHWGLVTQTESAYDALHAQTSSSRAHGHQGKQKGILNDHHAERVLGDIRKALSHFSFKFQIPHPRHPDDDPTLNLRIDAAAQVQKSPRHLVFSKKGF
jgi:hypothetical protein